MIELNEVFAPETETSKFMIEQMIIPHYRDFFNSIYDQSIPDAALAWKGPDLLTYNGWEEYWTSQYFWSKGYSFIKYYNLTAKQSKFVENNYLIRSMLGDERVEKFSFAVREWNQKGYSVAKKLDMLVFNNNEVFFVDVKRGRDFIKPNKLRFMYLAQEILGVQSRVTEMTWLPLEEH